MLTRRRIGQVAHALGHFLFLFILVRPGFAATPDEHLLQLIGADWALAGPRADRLPDLSSNALKAVEAHDRQLLANLRSIPRSGLRVYQTLYDLFDHQLNTRITQFQLYLYVTPFWDDSRYGYPLRDFAGILQAQPLESDSKQQLLSKLDALPTYTAQLIGLLRAGMQARMLPARVLVQTGMLPNIAVLRNRVQAFATAHDTALIADKALRGVKELELFVRQDYLAACNESPSLTQWPNGDQVYRALVRRYTTTDSTPQQLHEFGVREATRIRASIASLAKQAGFEGSVDDFLTSARRDQRFYVRRSDELLAAYRAAVTRIMPTVSKVVTAPSSIGALEIKPQPIGDGGAAAAYQPSDGTIVVDVSRPDIRPTFEIIALMLHEGVPGHHLQYSIERTAYGTPDSASIAAFELLMRRNNAFREGWALYAETLGDEMGVYSDPYDKLGQLSQELIRAGRVVIDTGIHEYGWSTSKARQYLMDVTGQPDAFSDAEVRRIIWFPGTQLAYSVGQERFSAMRRRGALKLGSRFDLRRFNDTLLKWGPLPLDLLEREFDECLAKPPCSVAFQASQ